MRCWHLDDSIRDGRQEKDAKSGCLTLYKNERYSKKLNSPSGASHSRLFIKSPFNK